jgi:hypothetical protein
MTWRLFTPKGDTVEKHRNPGCARCKHPLDKECQPDQWACRMSGPKEYHPVYGWRAIGNGMESCMKKNLDGTCEDFEEYVEPEPQWRGRR